MLQQAYLSKHKIKYVDWRDVNLLMMFINAHGRILSRKKTGCTVKQQSQVEVAIKRARTMSFLPYICY